MSEMFINVAGGVEFAVSPPVYRKSVRREFCARFFRTVPFEVPSTSAWLDMPLGRKPPLIAPPCRYVREIPVSGPRDHRAGGQPVRVGIG